jgi:nitrite reductase/ring-hydroxylating ferredoxin subunit
MTESNRLNSLERNSELVVAAVYERVVEASLERVWENVYDWEHLPWIHSEAFNSIERIASGDWGWRARVELANKAKAEIELITNRDAHHYVARTFAGAGTPSEIWTSLDPIAEDRTAIAVEFCVQPMPEEALENLGKGYVSLYTLLWDQDEAMMQTRQKALGERGSASAEPVEMRSLGSLDDVRARLPFTIEFAGGRFRIIEVRGELIAHSTECSHLLGPLDNCSVIDGSIVCPWHGYQFDVRTGRSSDGRALRLRSAPRVVIDASNGQVTIEDLRDGLSASGGSAA